MATSQLPIEDGALFALLDAEDEGLRPAPVDTETAARLAADRWLRVLAGLERQHAAAKAEYAAYTAHLALMHEQRIAPLLRAADYARAQLADLFRFIPTGKAKSVKLLNGTLGTRHHEAHLFVREAAAALGWAKMRAVGAHFWRTKTVESPDREALETYARDTGEIPPGCELAPERDDFYATPAP